LQQPTQLAVYRLAPGRAEVAGTTTTASELQVRHHHEHAGHREHDELGDHDDQRATSAAPPPRSATCAASSSAIGDGLFDDGPELRAFPVRLDPSLAAIAPGVGRAAPVAADHETREQRRRPD